VLAMARRKKKTVERRIKLEVRVRSEGVMNVLLEAVGMRVVEGEAGQERRGRSGERKGREVIPLTITLSSSSACRRTMSAALPPGWSQEWYAFIRLQACSSLVASVSVTKRRNADLRLSIHVGSSGVCRDEGGTPYYISESCSLL
jgi:hypothetical protein